MNGQKQAIQVFFTMISILKYILHSLLLKLIIIDLIIAGVVNWNIEKTCFVIHHGEKVLRFPLIEENYNLIIVGLCINIGIIIYQILNKYPQKAISREDYRIHILYNVVCYILILWGYGYIATTDHTNIITEYNPLFKFFIVIIKCDFLKEYHWVMRIFMVLSLFSVIINSISLYKLINSMFKLKKIG